MALPVLGILVIPFLWRALTDEGSGASLDILGAVLVAGTAAGMVLLVQSPSTGLLVAVVGVGLMVFGAPAVALQVRRRPHGFLPVTVIRNPLVVRSAVAAAAVPASWFAMLIAMPAVLLSHGWEAWQVGLAMVPSARSRSPCPGSPARCSPGSAPPGRWSWPPWSPRWRLAIAALGAHLVSAPVLVVAIVLVTFAFGVGQPALSAAVGDAVSPTYAGSHSASPRCSSWSAAASARPWWPGSAGCSASAARCCSRRPAAARTAGAPAHAARRGAAAAGARPSRIKLRRRSGGLRPHPRPG